MSHFGYNQTNSGNHNVPVSGGPAASRPGTVAVRAEDVEQLAEGGRLARMYCREAISRATGNEAIADAAADHAEFTFNSLWPLLRASETGGQRGYGNSGVRRLVVNGEPRESCLAALTALRSGATGRDVLASAYAASASRYLGISSSFVTAFTASAIAAAKLAFDALPTSQRAIEIKSASASGVSTVESAKAIVK